MRKGIITMTNQLMRISDIKVLELDEEFLTLSRPSAILKKLAHIPIEKTEEDVSLDAFDALIAKLLAASIDADTELDAMMAEELHKALPISRRQATDQNMWAWLGVMHSPDFVARRWPTDQKSGARSVHRYMGQPKRQTFSRIWWAAELSRNQNDYSLTNKIFSLPDFQQVYEDLFGRRFSHHRETLELFVDYVDGMKRSAMQQFAIELGVVFSTRPPECLTSAELSSLLSEVKVAVVGD